MSDINALLESFDQKYFTPEIKSKIVEAFDQKVQAKAEQLASEIANEEIEYAKIELNESFKEKQTQEIERLNNLAEQYVEMARGEYVEKLNTLAEQYVDEQLDEIGKTVNDYLEYCINEHIEDIIEALSKSVNENRANTIVECTRTLASLAKVQQEDIDTVNETINETKEQSTENTNKIINRLMSENRRLQQENDNLLQMGLINEMCDGLTVSQAERFKQLAEDFIDFSKDSKYVEKLGSLKEQVICNELDESHKPLNETVSKPTTAKKSGKMLDVWNKYC